VSRQDATDPIRQLAIISLSKKMRVMFIAGRKLPEPGGNRLVAGHDQYLDKQPSEVDMCNANR
jgi:hypothetical protein